VLRNRIRYPLIGASLVFVGGLSNLVDPFAPYPLDHAANLLNAFLLAYAVFRYQLADITLVVRKGLLYSIPTVIIGAGYFLIIYLATVLFQAFAGPQIFLLSLVVAVTAALVAQPLRDRAQHWVDRLFFRERYDAGLMLQRLSHTVASVLDLSNLTNMILDEVTSTMHIERAVFLLKQEKSMEFRLMAHRGLEGEPELRLRRDHPIVTWLSNHGQALRKYDMDLQPQFKALWGEERADLDRIGAELLIPLKAKGELVGILTVGPKLSGEAYLPDDELTLTTLANQTATALENARLLEEARRRNRELALLNRVIAASAADYDVDLILHTICQEVSLAFGVSQTVVALFNQEKTDALVVTDYLPLEPVSWKPQPSAGGDQADDLGLTPADSRALTVGMTVPLATNPLFAYQLQHKSGLIVDESQSDPSMAPIYESVRSRGVMSLLALPLLVEGEVVGSLSLNSFRAHTFSAEELDLARRVAEQVSSALARTRLAEVQRRLSTALEQAAEAVFIAETDGTLLYVNPAFEQISGYSQEKAMAQNVQTLLSSQQNPGLGLDIWQTIRAGEVWQGRLVNEKGDGTQYTADVTVTPVRTPSGEIVNYVATMRDVTREVQLEQQFYQSQKMEALGRFAGGIAHDFNNLLTIIHLSTRILQRQMNPDDVRWENVRRIRETGERAANLTRQLLSFSRREMIEPQVVDLADLVGNLSDMLERLIGEDVTLVTDLAENTWLVKADPTQMEQVIVNLAVNARDAMPHGGTLTIKTANVVLDQAYVTRHVDAQSGEHVMLAISDTGEGMDEEVQAHLFEPFFTTKEPGQGTGLGLSTVFGIVKQSDGHISVQSKVQQGTFFRIYLPRTQEEARPSTRDAQVSSLEGTETILLVEDETAVRDLTARTLRMQGYQVLTASDGQQALVVAEACAGPIHLLLTDVIMPRVDGRQLAAQLQSQRSGVRVLYMSGYVDRPLVKQFASDPEIAFLPKPFTEEALIHKVRSVLDARLQPESEDREPVSVREPDSVRG
jgi:PAS domain S-box-containing protein